MKVFWSWQSDTPGNIGRHFIKSALEAAILEIKLLDVIEESVRSELHLDSDRQGSPGSPDLALLILNKIDESFVFVGDVTSVCTIDKASEPEKQKKLINPNVAIELGYALRALGTQGLLMVMNDHYGSRADLPFDLRAKAGPITYTLAPNSSQEVKVTQKGLLKTRLKEALVLCVEQHIKTQQNVALIEAERRESNVGSDDWDKLATRFDEHCRFTRADTQWETGWETEQWTLAGGGDAMCKALLMRAGIMLLKSPKVAQSLPSVIRSNPDPLTRWFSFLKLRGHHRPGNYYTYPGTGRVGILGSISTLSQSSIIVCEECSAAEL